MAIEYKCENCAASLRFDVDSNMLVCDYCGSEFAVDYAENNMGKDSGNDEIIVSDNENWKEDYERNSDDDFVKMEIKQRTCPSCGGILLGDDVSMATFCAYCGNATLTETVVADIRTPEYIIPFKNTKEEAQKAFTEWGKKGFVTPSDFTSKSTIEKITGIYVPFYLYSCKSTCDYTAKAEKKYNKRFLGKEYEITEHFNVRRNITDKFIDIPADASEKMSDETMDLLEPFNMDELEEFKKAYMSGFLADKYSFTDKEMVERVAQRVIQFSKDSAFDHINGYDTVIPTGSKVDVVWNKTKYCMLPVWILNYNYNGKNFEFAMNGQTGKVVGTRPISTGKSILLFILWFLPSWLVISVIAFFFSGVASPLIGFIAALIIALIALFSSRKKQKTSMTTSGNNYKICDTVVNKASDVFIKKTRRVIDER